MLDRVGARRRERGPDDLEARPRNDALVDGVAQGDVVVAGAFGLEVPHRGEAVLEADLQRPHGAGDAVGRVLLEDLLVVLDRRRVALEKDVRVGVDQAGQEHPVAEVDDAGAGRHGRSDALDPVADHDDDRPFDVPAGLHVEEARGLDGHRSRRGRLGGEAGGRQKASEEGQGESFRHISS